MSDARYTVEVMHGINLDQLVASIRKPKPIALMTTIRDGGLRLHIAPELLQERRHDCLCIRDLVSRQRQ